VVSCVSTLKMSHTTYVSNYAQCVEKHLPEFRVVLFLLEDTVIEVLAVED